MKDLLDKLSSYNIFNYLLPGIIFVILAEALTSFSFVQKDIILGVFLYYFIGLVISRIGSLVIEPLLKLTKFVRFAAYPDFVAASKMDEKLDVLSEANNMYRTLCSLFFLLIFVKVYERIAGIFPAMSKWRTEILVASLFLLFCFSYRKQTQYITKRVETVTRKR
jgi:hypothetical protein